MYVLNKEHIKKPVGRPKKNKIVEIIKPPDKPKEKKSLIVNLME
jgi:hypothetical protein